MNPWIPIVISAIATLISLLGYLRNRPKLIQIRKTSSKMYEPIVEGQIGAEYFEHEKTSYDPIEQKPLSIVPEKNSASLFCRQISPAVFFWGAPANFACFYGGFRLVFTTRRSGSRVTERKIR